MIRALRIPKAASSAVVSTLGEYTDIEDHYYRLEDVPDGDIAFAVLRDPVDRFRSAFDMFWHDERMPVRDYGTIDAFIDAGPTAWDDLAFWPSVYWLRSAEYVRARGAIVMPYETFALDFGQMGFRVPRISHLAQVRHEPTLLAPLHEHYAEDYILREELFA